MSPPGGDRRHSADLAEPVILSKLRTRICEDTMRHYVVTTQLLRQASNALDDEVAQAPERHAEPRPEPRPQVAGGRLVAVARRARALAVRVLAARAA
jgi:hypothetical protein